MRWGAGAHQQHEVARVVAQQVARAVRVDLPVRLRRASARFEPKAPELPSAARRQSACAADPARARAPDSPELAPAGPHSGPLRHPRATEPRFHTGRSPTAAAQRMRSDARRAEGPARMRPHPHDRRGERDRLGGLAAGQVCDAGLADDYHAAQRRRHRDEHGRARVQVAVPPGALHQLLRAPAARRVRQVQGGLGYGRVGKARQASCRPG